MERTIGMRPLHSALSLFLAILLTAVFAAIAPRALAEESQLTPEEAWAPSDHIVGDTIARGVDFALRPVYTGASRAFFWAFEPPEPEHITVIKMEGCPVQPQPQPQPEE